MPHSRMKRLPLAVTKMELPVSVARLRPPPHHQAWSLPGLGGFTKGPDRQFMCHSCAPTSAAMSMPSPVSKVEPTNFVPSRPV